MKYYNELEQSWRKLKENHPDVAKAIARSDERQYLNGNGIWCDYDDGKVDDYDSHIIYRAPIPEPIKLDTRRIAGWWCHDDEERIIKMMTCVNEDGGVSESAEDHLQYRYSKDPMLPLDQWKTLEEICAEAER